MGLDIYLSGRITPAYPHSEYRSDGKEVEEVRVRLAHWRKDWALQNYMMENYPDEGDPNSEWTFSATGLRELLKEIFHGALNGRDEGQPYPPESFEQTISNLKSAIEWVEQAPTTEWRDVVYRASW